MQKKQKMSSTQNIILKDEIKRKLLESEEDYKNGRYRKAEDVFKEWEEKYGI